MRSGLRMTLIPPSDWTNMRVMAGKVRQLYSSKNFICMNNYLNKMSKSPLPPFSKGGKNGLGR